MLIVNMSSISKAHEALAQVFKGKTALDLDDDVKIKCILMVGLSDFNDFSVAENCVFLFIWKFCFQKVNSIPPAELSINNLDASIFMVDLYELMQISTDRSEYNA